MTRLRCSFDTYLLGDLYIGDNVLWYEDAGSFSSAFCLHFIRESLAKRITLVFST